MALSFGTGTMLLFSIEKELKSLKIQSSSFYQRVLTVGIRGIQHAEPKDMVIYFIQI
jgi:hypothetical protein